MSLHLPWLADRHRQRCAPRRVPGRDARITISAVSMLILAISACSQRAQTPQQTVSTAPRTAQADDVRPQRARVAKPNRSSVLRTIHADYTHSAFGGTLLGTDRGEWIGELLFRDEAGGIEPLLHENVLGIVENRAGVFVFTGLRHMSTNVGFIYAIALTGNHDIIATRLGRLPGEPSDVTRRADGTTTFLVATDRYDADGGRVYDCLELVGRVVRHSLDCLPPKSP